MNLDMLKGRVAEAFVEDIFVQAGYWVARGGRETQLQRLLRNGSDELPDFLACRSQLTPRPPVHRLIALEVKYRSTIGEYLRRDGCTDCSKLAEQQWLEAYLVLVTDNPGGARSCFQAVDLKEYTAGTEPGPVDLHEVRDLDIPKSTVKKYENLLRRMFDAVRAESRKPTARMASRAGAPLVSLGAFLQDHGHCGELNPGSNASESG